MKIVIIAIDEEFFEQLMDIVEVVEFELFVVVEIVDFVDFTDEQGDDFIHDHLSVVDGPLAFVVGGTIVEEFVVRLLYD